MNKQKQGAKLKGSSKNSILIFKLGNQPQYEEVKGSYGQRLAGFEENHPKYDFKKMNPTLECVVIGWTGEIPSSKNKGETYRIYYVCQRYTKQKYIIMPNSVLFDRLKELVAGTAVRIQYSPGTTKTGSSFDNYRLDVDKAFTPDPNFHLSGVASQNYVQSVSSNQSPTAGMSTQAVSAPVSAPTPVASVPQFPMKLFFKAGTEILVSEDGKYLLNHNGYQSDVPVLWNNGVPMNNEQENDDVPF